MSAECVCSCFLDLNPDSKFVLNQTCILNYIKFSLPKWQKLYDNLNIVYTDRYYRLGSSQHHCCDQFNVTQ